MQTINYKKWIYKFQILGLLSLLTACDPPATKTLEQTATATLTIKLAKKVTPEVQAYFDALNALDLKHPELIQKAESLLNALNALAQADLNAQAALNALKNARDSGDSNLATLKVTKKTEANDALGKLGTLKNNFEESVNELYTHRTTEEESEYNNKVKPVIDNNVVDLDRGNELYTDTEECWGLVDNFQ